MDNYTGVYSDVDSGRVAETADAFVTELQDTREHVDAQTASLLERVTDFLRFVKAEDQQHRERTRTLQDILQTTERDGSAELASHQSLLKEMQTRNVELTRSLNEAKSTIERLEKELAEAHQHHELSRNTSQKSLNNARETDQTQLDPALDISAVLKQNEDLETQVLELTDKLQLQKSEFEARLVEQATGIQDLEHEIEAYSEREDQATQALALLEVRLRELDEENAELRREAADAASVDLGRKGSGDETVADITMIDQLQEQKEARMSVELELEKLHQQRKSMQGAIQELVASNASLKQKLQLKSSTPSTPTRKFNKAANKDEDTSHWIADMFNRGVPVNAMTCNTALLTAIDINDIGLAVKLLHSMRNASLAPPRFVYLRLCTALVDHGDVTRFRTVVDCMQRDGVDLPVTSAALAISTATKEQGPQAAINLGNDLLDKGVDRDALLEALKAYGVEDKVVGQFQPSSLIAA